MRVLVLVACEYGIDIKFEQIRTTAQVSISGNCANIWFMNWCERRSHTQTHTHSHVNAVKCRRQLTAFAKHPHIIMAYYSEEVRSNHFFRSTFLSFKSSSSSWFFSPSNAPIYDNRCGYHKNACVLCGLAFQFYTCGGFWSTESLNRAQFI